MEGQLKFCITVRHFLPQDAICEALDQPRMVAISIKDAYKGVYHTSYDVFRLTDPLSHCFCHSQA